MRRTVEGRVFARPSSRATTAPARVSIPAWLLEGGQPRPAVLSCKSFEGQRGVEVSKLKTDHHDVAGRLCRGS